MEGRGDGGTGDSGDGHGSNCSASDNSLARGVLNVHIAPNFGGFALAVSRRNAARMRACGERTLHTLRGK